MNAAKRARKKGIKFRKNRVQERQNIYDFYYTKSGCLEMIPIKLDQEIFPPWINNSTNSMDKMIRNVG